MPGSRLRQQRRAAARRATTAQLGEEDDRSIYSMADHGLRPSAAAWRLLPSPRFIMAIFDGMHQHFLAAIEPRYRDDGRKELDELAPRPENSMRF